MRAKGEWVQFEPRKKKEKQEDRLLKISFGLQKKPGEESGAKQICT